MMVGIVQGQTGILRCCRGVIVGHMRVIERTYWVIEGVIEEF